MTFRSIPFEARPIKATEKVLEDIYQAARRGLKGTTLALAANLLPVELNRLQEFDPNARMAEDKGRADMEMEMSGVVLDAARAGDAKAAMDILKHRADWVQKQQISIDITKQISVLDALAAADQRLAIANQDNVTDLEPRMIPTKEKTA